VIIETDSESMTITSMQNEHTITGVKMESLTDGKERNSVNVVYIVIHKGFEGLRDFYVQSCSSPSRLGDCW